MNDLFKDRKYIISWLNRYNIENYTLIEDKEHGYIVDVAGDVDLFHKNIHSIPLKFNVVSGYFDCGGNLLTSLEAAPISVGENFNCSHNHLTSLEGAPISVGGSFYCYANELTSLLGGPESVSGEFSCYNNIDLGKYQEITDFKIIREKITSDKEKKVFSTSLGNSRLNCSVLKI